MHEINDAFDAANIVLNHLVDKGIVVFSEEVKSIVKKNTMWWIEIKGVTYNGIILLNSITGEISETIKL